MKEEGGRRAYRNHNEIHLTMALLSLLGCCHLMSIHQVTGQLLLLSASTQTQELMEPRHSSINHLMMSYHGDHWALPAYIQDMIRREGTCYVPAMATHTIYSSVPKYILWSNLHMSIFSSVFWKHYCNDKGTI